ncbi:MAG: L,D-transpeptidase, partial [Betaproteobacteria bacterium]|nr:L,D-transpeptidase [Betaproteobacteria bacterium]
MASRRKVILALGAMLVPAAAIAATPAAPTKPETSKPLAKKPPPAKKPDPKKQVVKKKAPPPPPRLIITVNKVSQKMTVTLDGDELYKWPISTGAPGYDTPSGNFRPFRMEKEHFSKEWDDAPMPYSIFFTGAGHAVHGSYHVKSLGRRASHGCVRLHPDNAAKLFALVHKTGMSNTRVIVKGGFFGGGQISDMI